jgi:hypothetical protein
MLAMALHNAAVQHEHLQQWRHALAAYYSASRCAANCLGAPDDRHGLSSACYLSNGGARCRHGALDFADFGLCLRGSQQNNSAEDGRAVAAGTLRVTESSNG